MALSNAQYDELMREYSRRQLEGVHTQRKRRQEVFEKIPAIAQLEDDITALGIRYARAALLDETAETDHQAVSAAHFRAQAKQIRTKRNQLLTQAGYPAHYLEIPYQCPDCQDTGYINGQRCHCFKSAAIDLFYTQSGLRKTLEEENFSHFRYDLYPMDLISNATGKSARENILGIVETCRLAISHIDEKPCSFLFYGATGLGKTFLSHCLAKELLDNAHSVMYYSAPMLFDTLADIRFSRNTDSPETDSYINECDFLIIDDLGTELTNAFTASALFTILNERISRGKSTLISTNLMLQDLAENYSERVFSRISSSFRLFEFFGDDIRLHRQLRSR